MPKGEFEHYSDDTNSWNCTVALLPSIHFSFIGWLLTLFSMTSFIAGTNYDISLQYWCSIAGNLV